MNIVVLPEAAQDIDRLYDFLISAGKSLSAQKAMLAIDEGIKLLLKNPYIGVDIENHPNYQQLFVPFGKSAYVLRYRIDLNAQKLIIVRIWHGRENRL